MARALLETAATWDEETMTATLDLDSIEAHVLLLQLRDVLEHAENQGDTRTAAVADDVLTRLESAVSIRGTLVMTESAELEIKAGPEHDVVQKAIADPADSRLTGILDSIEDQLPSK